MNNVNHIKKGKMKSIIHNIFRFIFCVAAFSVVTLTAYADRVPLITDASQLSSNASEAGYDGDMARLIDGNAGTHWRTRDNYVTEKHYIQVDLGYELGLDPATEDLVVFTQRHRDYPLGHKLHPTTFNVLVSSDGVNWESFRGNGQNSTHVYFLYRGYATKEYSSRITTDKKFRYMRFELEANNSRTYVSGSTDIRRMQIGEFQIYRLNRDDDYSDILVDRIRLKTDYRDGYKDFGFDYTHGAADKRNRGLGDIPDNYTTWTKWTGDGRWEETDPKFKKILEDNNIQMPDMSYITSDDDEDLAPGQVRQRTHVVEHVLYAIPGDAIALYPFYRMATVSNYQEHFSHWYDYKTGGRLKDDRGNDLLDFLIDPSDINRTENHGFIGGDKVNNRIAVKEEDIFKINTPEDFNEFAARVNAGETSLFARVTADLDFSGVETVPVGTDANPYAGVFDGGGHTFSNVNINLPEENSAGLFRVVLGGTICNFTLDSTCSITGGGIVNNNKCGTGVVGYYKASQGAPALTLEGIINHGHVAGKGYAGGILGTTDTNNSTKTFVINACAFTGSVESTGQASMMVGNGSINENRLVSNSWGTGTVACGNLTAGYQLFSGTTPTENCFANITADGVTTFDGNLADIKDALAGKGWKWEDNTLALDAKPAPSYNIGTAPARYYGTVATFFYPRDPYVEGGLQTRLPENEYVIAADFSQDFNFDKHVDLVNNKFIEPVIHFRHIFRIRDGHTFAEEFSGSAANNREYVRKNMRHVSARANVDFQVRLDSPVPVYDPSNDADKLPARSKWYYKISDTDYRRVCSSEIEVFNTDTGEKLPDGTFVFSEEIDGQGRRKIDGDDYFICGGGGKYYRMLSCPAANARAGRYTVRIMGRDYNGNRIKIYDAATGKPGTEDLVVQELRITFLPESSALMVEADEMGNGKYDYATEEHLRKMCGEPRAVINFDQYSALVGNKSNDYTDRNSDNHSYFKWPIPWDQSDYAFTYNNTADFGVYRLASHSIRTAWSTAAGKYPAERNFNQGKGLYDRLFYNTKGHSRGFFYYVNAADDPGVMARLVINELCQGSTLHVSAYLAEFSATKETGNIAFNFIAVLKGTGQRVPLHTFTSGYVKSDPAYGEDYNNNNMPFNPSPDEQRGKWQKIYYSFVPSFTDTGITSSDVDHYELELDNNCKSSQGADYAIDDIRVYVVRPAVYSSQMAPLCDGSEYADVRIEMPFNVLLQTIGLTAASDETEAQNVSVYYTFLDKETYDQALADNKDGTTAFNEAQLKYQYDLSDNNKQQTFGKLLFSSYFDNIPEFSAGNISINAVMRKEMDGVRYIVFNTRPQDSGLHSGKEYIAALYASCGGVDEMPGASEFDISSSCSKSCEFSVHGSGVIKIDGIAVPDRDAISCCENQQPVVQIDLIGKKTDGTGGLVTLDPNARFDWYAGTRVQFDKETMTDGTTLLEVMAKFREDFRDAANAMVVPKENGVFTEEMRDYLLELTTPHDGKPAKVSLYSSSYVFPPVVIPDGQDETYVQVLAVPIEIKRDGYIICTEPTEVRIRVLRHAPGLSHGFGIDYPEYINDVPLRIGLRQLEEVCVEDPENTDKALNIPVRTVVSTSDGFTKMTYGDDRYLYLAETNDPEYKDLGVDGTGLKPVGYLKELVADRDVSFGTNIIRAAFDKTFNFKEAYYYRFAFNFDEELKGAVEEDDMPCPGRHVFTLKIVPEYVKWVGKTGPLSTLNWNSDRNWHRVTSDDLHRTKDETDKYTTDGSNGARFSYAPLDFTKTIIPDPADKKSYDYGEDESMETNVSGSPYMYAAKKTKSVRIRYDGLDNTYLWPEDPEDKAPDSPAGKPKDMLDLIKGGVTYDVQYDMTAFVPDISGKSGIYCRPWYMNACEQIHFSPRALIYNQQHLVYERAWVDMELEPSMWHTLSSPLKGVIAGDMYLPSATARQETELFKDIHFSFEDGVNNRFRPAVFQRSWNKGTANVYELKDKGAPRNVAVATAWSRVFNDVKESYGAGNGFSIKTDLSRMDDKTRPASVLFRLPKADTFYDYYNETGDETGDRTDVTLLHADAYRLNDTKDQTFTVTSAARSRYFLVGNPFMSRLDMVKFLKANEAVIEPKYWILTGNNQTAAVMNGATLVATDGSENVTLPPLQGFFVEAKSEGVSLDLKYDEDMMDRNVTGAGTVATRASDSAGMNGGLVISATTDSGHVSKALLCVDKDASRGYRSSEDVMVLTNPDMDIPAFVYTVADGKAVAINTVPDPESTEVGIETTGDCDVTLRFDHTGCVSGYMLYDSGADTYTPITEGMAYRVEAGSRSRFFITAGMTPDEAGAIRISTKGNTVTVNTTRGQLDVKVFDILGRRIAAVSEESGEVNVTLDSGIYIVKASDGVDTVVRKIIL